MINRQLEHSEIINSRKKFPLVVLCDNIESPENVGMIFRVCEAMGVGKIYLTGTTLALPNRKISKISRSTDKLVAWEYAEVIGEVIERLRSDSYEIMAVEVTDNSKYLTDLVFTPDKKLALIIGSEKHGVSASALEKAEVCCAIEMFGENSSMNVVTALSMVLYECSRQLNEKL
jgi:tRNA G18 (ribose-2'-O)-methylase SpoU